MCGARWWLCLRERVASQGTCPSSPSCSGVRGDASQGTCPSPPPCSEHTHPQSHLLPLLCAPTVTLSAGYANSAAKQPLLHTRPSMTVHETVSRSSRLSRQVTFGPTYSD